MDITTEDIKQNFASVSNNRQLSIQFAHVARERSAEEEQYNKEAGRCPISNISKHLGNLKSKKLANYIRNNFDDPSVMKAMKCLTGGIYYHTLDTSGRLNPTNEIANWFTDLKQIGTDSTSGNAVIGSIKDAGGIVVFKSPKDPQDKELVHELFVGMRGTNLLRDGSAIKKPIVNFSYVYGGFQCAPSIIDSGTKQVVSMCADPTKLPVQYIIYEAVNPGVDFSSSVKTVTPNEYLSTLLQICVSTKVANDAIGWTHYDLHAANIRLREVPMFKGQDFYIPYEYSNGIKVYVKANRVATFIDYGNSHIVYKGKSYGVNSPQYNIYPDRDFPLFDIYRFLMSSGEHLLFAGNPKCIDIGRLFYSYFNANEDYARAIIQQRGTYSVLPYEKVVASGKNIHDLLLHVSSQLVGEQRDYFIDNLEGVKIPTIGCEDLNRKCYRESTIYNNIGVSKNSPIVANSFMDYYDLISKANLNSNELKDLNASFTKKYKNAQKEYLGEYRAFIEGSNQISNQINSNSEFDIQRLREMGDKLYEKELLEFITYHFTLLSYADFLNRRMVLYYHVGKTVASRYRDKDLILSLEKIDKSVKTQELALLTLKDKAKEILEFIQKELRTGKGLTFLKQNRYLEWYLYNADAYL